MGRAKDGHLIPRLGSRFCDTLVEARECASASSLGIRSSNFCHNFDTRKARPGPAVLGLAKPVARQQMHELVAAVDPELAVGGVELGAQGRPGDAAAAGGGLATRRQRL